MTGRRADVVDVARATPAVFDLAAPVSVLKGVGPVLAARLATHGLGTLRELLLCVPRRYEDRRATFAIADLVPGERASLEGEVRRVNYRAFGRQRSLEVVLGDESGAVSLVWFRVPGKSFAERFAVGSRWRVAGLVAEYRGRRQLAHPEARPAGEGVALADALVPVYSEFEGLPAPRLRQIIASALPAAVGFAETLPAELRQKHGLPSLAEAVLALHAPPADADLTALAAMQSPWHLRLIYEELLLLQLAVLRRRAHTQRETGRAVGLASPLAAQAARLFAFPLTAAQHRVLAELAADLGKAAPMQRLLQGDVGSGKTAVALAAAAAVARAGEQVAIMAPTELLVEQHARTARAVLVPDGVRVAVLTGSLRGAERRQVLAEMASGEAQVVIGTHALLEPGVAWRSLRLAVIDEQHRFGVEQRAALVARGRESGGGSPHVLVMTATPIPRTLALCAYGDLDVSLIDELPPGRSAVRTEVFRDAERRQVGARLVAALRAGRQAYIVYPLVEESDGEGMVGVRDATRAAAALAKGTLAGFAVGLLHGRLSRDEKEHTMRAFAAGELAALVATTVVEVGIDVPNATVMVIEHAERFGLSQLHQLRGRVGRGTQLSECLLLASAQASDEANERLATLERTQDGFRVAEEDLRLRGPGDLAGTRQSGMPLLGLANLARDEKWLLAAREDAREVLARDAELRLSEHAGLAGRLAASVAAAGVTAVAATICPAPVF